MYGTGILCHNDYHSRKEKQNMLKEGLVQEISSNAVKPANSFNEVMDLLLHAMNSHHK